MPRRLLLTAYTMGELCTGAVAQVAFPAPLPNQSSPDVFKKGFFQRSLPGFDRPQQNPSAAQDAFPVPLPNQAPQAQGAFPLPLPNRSAPPVFLLQQSPTTAKEDCMAKFAPLRADAEKRAKLIQAASARKATAREACSLIKAYVASENKVVDYVTANQTACGIPEEIPNQLKVNQSKSQEMMKRVCEAARNQDRPIILDLPELEPRPILDPPLPDQRRYRILRTNTPVTLQVRPG
jgi:hypothetical protein